MTNIQVIGDFRLSNPSNKQFLTETDKQKIANHFAKGAPSPYLLRMWAEEGEHLTLYHCDRVNQHTLIVRECSWAKPEIGSASAEYAANGDVGSCALACILASVSERSGYA